MRYQLLVILMVVLLCIPGCKKSEPKRSKEMDEMAKQAVSWKNLSEINQAGYSYLMKHDGVPAPSLTTLVEEGLLEIDSLISPMSGRGPLMTDKNGVPTEPGDYIYLPRCFSEEAVLEGVIMVYEKPENYRGSLSSDGTLALVSGGVLWMDIEDFQEALAKTEKWLAEYEKNKANGKGE